MGKMQLIHYPHTTDFPGRYTCDGDKFAGFVAKIVTANLRSPFGSVCKLANRSFEASVSAGKVFGLSDSGDLFGKPIRNNTQI